MARARGGHAGWGGRTRAELASAERAFRRFVAGAATYASILIST
jgi:hypothetical protein